MPLAKFGRIISLPSGYGTMIRGSTTSAEL